MLVQCGYPFAEPVSDHYKTTLQTRRKAAWSWLPKIHEIKGKMLELDNPRWMELNDVYGSAAGIPGLLWQLSSLPGDEDEAEPWFSLWSALAHQGDVYPASFAAVPHVVAALAQAPEQAGDAYFHFPAWIEICRHRNAVDIPHDLKAGYFDALRRIPELAASAANRPWSMDFTACVLSAVAAAKGQHDLAEAMLEMTSPETAREFLEWSFDR